MLKKSKGKGEAKQPVKRVPPRPATKVPKPAKKGPKIRTESDDYGGSYL